MIFGLIGEQLPTGTPGLPSDDSDTGAALSTLQQANLAGHRRSSTGNLDRHLEAGSEESGAQAPQDIQEPLLRRAG